MVGNLAYYDLIQSNSEIGELLYDRNRADLRSHLTYKISCLQKRPELHPVEVMKKNVEIIKECCLGLAFLFQIDYEEAVKILEKLYRGYDTYILLYLIRPLIESGQIFLVNRILMDARFQQLRKAFIEYPWSIAAPTISREIIEFFARWSLQGRL